MSNEALKTCPFYHGGKGQFLEIEVLSRPYQVKCAICGASGPKENTQEEAIAAWNKRAKE